MKTILIQNQSKIHGDAAVPRKRWIIRIKKIGVLSTIYFRHEQLH